MIADSLQFVNPYFYFPTEINFQSNSRQICYTVRMMTERMLEIFEEVETEREYNGYYYSVTEAISIVVLGSLCGLKNVSQIHQWAENERTREFLKEKFAIKRIPCYYWLLSLLKMVKPESLNRCLNCWVSSIMPKKREGLSVAVDGKTIRSTEKMKEHLQPLQS